MGALLRHAITATQAAGFEILRITGAKGAAPFYEACGLTPVRSTENRDYYVVNIAAPLAGNALRLAGQLEKVLRATDVPKNADNKRVTNERARILSFGTNRNRHSPARRCPTPDIRRFFVCCKR
jgi:hypothetical protein